MRMSAPIQIRMSPMPMLRSVRRTSARHSARPMMARPPKPTRSIRVSMGGVSGLDGYGNEGRGHKKYGQDLTPVSPKALPHDR